ncbi:MAG TPA: J domain-containing protein [Allocoleopsis sp.]
MNLEEYYRILELPNGSSPAEIRQSYKDLVIVWHPDRFTHLPRLQQKAESKLKEINIAYKQLLLICGKKTPINHSQTSDKSEVKSSEYQDKGKNIWQKEDRIPIDDLRQFSRQSVPGNIHVWLD